MTIPDYYKYLGAKQRMIHDFSNRMLEHFSKVDNRESLAFEETGGIKQLLVKMKLIKHTKFRFGSLNGSLDDKK